MHQPLPVFVEDSLDKRDLAEKINLLDGEGYLLVKLDFVKAVPHVRWEGDEHREHLVCQACGI